MKLAYHGLAFPLRALGAAFPRSSERSNLKPS
jgi:hypothetical protein